MMMLPRYYQQQAHDAVWDYLRNTSGNPIVVLPTGAGKSLLAAMLVRQALEFDARVMLIQHRKELIEQNAEKIRLLLPGVPVGINSAGLRRHAFDEDVICGGIQTIYKRAAEFGRRELVVIDEAHLIGTDSDSMYAQFVHDLKQLNPKSRFVGLTATPYRTGEGPICRPDKLFQRICYEVQTGDLIREGWLSPLINKAADSSVDTSAIKQRGGEFLAGDMEKTFDDDCKTESACREIIARTTDRKSVLLFCAGVAHAEHVAAAIAGITGEEVGIVTGETFAMERQRILSDFKSGRLRWCVNVDVLTTGFDSPRIDAIAVLRATMSPGLFAQIVGRGLRKHESKTDCIADGQRVLTDHGLIEIQDVKPSMKVWDGVEFVAHCGIILRGEMPVITYAGLTATEDHNVWTKKGWMPFGQAKLTKAEICVTGDNEKTVWKSENRFKSDNKERERQGLCQSCLSGMWSGRTKRLRFRSSVKSRMQKVWKKAKFCKALSRCPKVAVKTLHISKTEVHKSSRQSLVKLWRTRNNFRFRLSEPNGHVFNRKFFNYSGPGDRPNQQRLRICTRKHQTSEADRKRKQQEGWRWRATYAQIPPTTSSNNIRRLNSFRIASTHDIHGSCEKIQHEVEQAKRRVWDIVNCGPRNRFTCEGLLVSNCLILDFGENIKRHGSLDDPEYGRASVGRGGNGVGTRESENNGRGKQCPNCGLDVAARSATCPECGLRFPANHDQKPDEESTITGQAPPEVWQVVGVTWNKHQKRNDPDAPPTLRVNYECQPANSEAGNLTLKHISEWICLEHQGFAWRKACQWWEARSVAPVPVSIDDALYWLTKAACRMPAEITTTREGKYYRITACRFCDEIPEPDDYAADKESEQLVNEFGEEVPF